MACSFKWAPQQVRVRTQVRAKESARAGLVRFLLLIVPSVVFAIPTFCQDRGSAESEFRGNGAEITVTVHDSSGEPISSAAVVKVYRDGGILSRQGETSRGHAVLVVNSLGEFTVIVEAAGFESAKQQVTINAAGRAQVDVYLRRISSEKSVSGVPGRPTLAPKAKEALEKGLQSLSADKIKDSEKYVSEAMRLAPSHPDVLYVQGVLFLKQRNWTQAQNVLEKATQLDPNHARAFAALGMAFAEQGKYDAAIAALQQSLQLHAAGSWETRWTLAKAYYQSTRYDDALKMSQEALAASNGMAPEIGLLVAQSLTAVGRYEDAATLLREFLKEHGDRREAATARRWLEQLTASAKIQPNAN
jgi:uncharacterized protein HemY